MGITEVTPDDIARAGRDGEVIKLVGTAECVNDAIRLSVAPRRLKKDHPLASVNGSEKAISYMTDTMDRITVSGGKSSPKTKCQGGNELGGCRWTRSSAANGGSRAKE